MNGILGFTDRQKKEIRLTLGKNLAAARRNAGMSQSDVMKAVWGVSNNRNRISEIENGHKELTIYDLLLFQSFYGQSLDYMCGLAVEPTVHMLAGTVNHVVNETKSLIELMAEEMAEVVIGKIKPIENNDINQLIGSIETLCSAIQSCQHDSIGDDITTKLNQLMHTLRYMDMKQARQIIDCETSIEGLKENICDYDEANNEEENIKLHYLLDTALSGTSQYYNTPIMP